MFIAGSITEVYTQVIGWLRAKMGNRNPLVSRWLHGEGRGGSYSWVALSFLFTASTSSRPTNERPWRGSNWYSDFRSPFAPFPASHVRIVRTSGAYKHPKRNAFSINWTDSGIAYTFPWAWMSFKAKNVMWKSCNPDFSMKICVWFQWITKIVASSFIIITVFTNRRQCYSLRDTSKTSAWKITKFNSTYPRYLSLRVIYRVAILLRRKTDCVYGKILCARKHFFEGNRFLQHSCSLASELPVITSLPNCMCSHLHSLRRISLFLEKRSWRATVRQ